MNALPEVSLHTPEKVNEQFNHSPSAVVGLTKPSILTFSCSPENADDKEERLSPQSVLDSFLGDGISPSHKTRTQGIEFKIRTSPFEFPFFKIVEVPFCIFLKNPW